MTKILEVANCHQNNLVGHIVFVHGLNGDPGTTWTGASNFYWPQELGKELEYMGIFSVDYNAAASNWQGGKAMPLPDLAENIIAYLQTKQIGTLPIVFICHSLGGLVVKQILRNCSTRKDSAKEIFNHTKGIAFIATPHSGSLAGSVVKYLSHSFMRPSPLLKTLDWNNPNLRELNTWFRETFSGSVAAYYEKLPVMGLCVIVDANSSDPGMNSIHPVPIEADHMSICKPNSTDDLIYSHTKLFIKNIFELKKKWDNEIATYKNELFKEIDERPVGIAPPFLHLWKDFIVNANWHDSILLPLKRVPEYCNDASLINKITSLPDCLQYSKISKICSPLIVRSIQALTEGLATQKDAQLYESCENLIDDLQRQLELLRHPRYNRCFCISGSSGEGKSYFINFLINDIATGNWIIPLSRPIKSQNLREKLLEFVNQFSAYKWPTFEKFMEWFSQAYPGQRIIVIIDNFHDWLDINLEYRSELKDLIEHYSNTKDFIYWIVTIHDNRYEAIASHSSFYINYSGHFVDNSQSFIGGWISINSFNERGKIGLKILQETDAPMSDLPSVQESVVSTQHFINPFIAWIARDLYEEKKLLNFIDIRYIEFVEKFWNKRKEQLEIRLNNKLGNSTSGLIDDGIVLTADFFSQVPITVNYSALIDHIVNCAQGRSELIQRDRVEYLLDALADTSLLKKKKVIIGYEVGLLFNTFWEFNIANYYFNKFGPGVCSALDHSLISQSTSFADGILEFLFLIISKNFEDSQTEVSINELLKPVSENPELLNKCCQALAFACSKSSEAFKQHFADWLLLDEKEPLIANNIYSCMYFLANCPHQIISLEERFSLVRPHYSVLREKSLSHFFLYFVSKNIDGVYRNRPLIESLSYLSGCEILDIPGNDEIQGIKVTESTARLIAERLFDNCGAGKVDDLIDSFLRHLCSHIKKYNQEIARTRGDSFQRKFFIEWLICYFCRKLVELYGFGSYRLFDKHGWYKKTSGNLNIRMEREANGALGFWFRHKATSSERQEYLRLVKDLSASDNPQKIQRSFFLIYATLIEDGDIISPEFHTSLQIISKKINSFKELHTLKYNFGKFIQDCLSQGTKQR